MRNLATYPLRDEEVQDWLDRQMKAYLESQLVGGMDGVIIQHLKDLAQAHPVTTTTETTTASN